MNAATKYGLNQEITLVYSKSKVGRVSTVGTATRYDWTVWRPNLGRG